MKKLVKNAISEKLSLYIDGQLTEDETKEVESLLQSDPLLQEEFKELLRLKQMLSSQPRLEPSVAFWAKLSQRLENEHRQQRRSFPSLFGSFHPALVVTAMGCMVVLGIVLYSVYFDKTTTKEQVSASRQKNLLPLFTSISKDEALRFSFLGLLPIDQKNQTTIEVDEPTQKCCRIKVSKSSQQKAVQLTMDRFVAEIKPTPEQKQVIDSLLQIAQQRICTSLFVGEDKALAIDPSLPQFNRMVVSGITSTLHPEQRTKMERLLASFQTPTYVRDEASKGVASSDAGLKQFPKVTHNRTFVVITPDTILYSDMQVDMDSLLDLWQKRIADMEIERQQLIEQFIQQDFSTLRRRNVAQVSSGLGSTNEFQIEVSPEIQAPATATKKHGLTILPSDSPSQGSR